MLQPPTKPRFILATNVAEASVTVPGVDFVIDSGAAKVMEMNPRTGFSSLELSRISRFNAHQRAGRAARQKAGVCVRLWTPHEEATQMEEPVPECRRVDLSSALLWLAQLGVTQFMEFAWFDPPSEVLIGWALRSLNAMGALDSSRRLTDLGRRLLKFPLPPRWGALLAKGDEIGAGETAARLAAILGDRDFAQGDVHANTECDALLRLELLSEVERGQRPRGVNFRQAQIVLESSRQLRSLVGKGGTNEKGCAGCCFSPNKTGSAAGAANRIGH